MPASPLTFDFVIVGAGSAGCVLADRLSACGKYTVAIIEAGGTDRRFYVQMPLGYGKTFHDPRLNWGYRAEPDASLAGRCDYWPRGKLLGGSSSINAMVFIRGHARDFDDWAAQGNSGWTYADCLPHFKSIENNLAGADAWRGAGGPLVVSDNSASAHSLARRFVAAGLEAGLPLNRDFNGSAQDGIGYYQLNTSGGWRMSAAKAFLRPALRRKNVALFTYAHVRHLLFEGGRASGVAVQRGGHRLEIRARREVILCAGAVNTPQLLHLSGIGPAALLQKLGIAQVHDSPAAGHFLQDHLGINYTYRSRIPTLNDELRSWPGKLRAGLDLLLRGRGPLSASLNQAGGFVRTRPGLDRPNIQLYLQAISTVQAQAGTRPLLTPDSFSGFSLGLSTCKPQSRGSILACSPDPIVAPKIIANAFGTPQDLQDMLEGVKFLRHLAAQPALAGIIGSEIAPGPQVSGEDALIADCRARSGTVYHPVGTARMGPDPANAVADARLQVYGIEGLRIADASIFPSIVSGNTNAAVMMAGAKAAAMILADAR